VGGLHREAFGYHREDDAIGPAPGRGNVEARAAWQAAYSALDAPEGERQIAARDDAELRNLIHDYKREEVWAPAFVDDELREANLAARDYHTQLVFERAGDGAPDRTNEERAQAAQRIADLEALNERIDKRAANLDEIAQARSAWYAETVESRELANQARVELRRRGVGEVAEEPVHSETAEVERAERDEPEPVSLQELATVLERNDQEPASYEVEPELTQRTGSTEPVETPVPGEEQVRDEATDVDKSEPSEPPLAKPDEPKLVPERDDSEAPVRETELEPAKQPAREEITENRVQAELQKAREATEILAERQAERHRAEVDASAERDREYARRLGDEPEYEVEFQHEVDDHVADIGHNHYEG
jgi:hypothetical protein